MIDATPLLPLIEDFIERRGGKYSQTQFGKDVLKDPNFVFDIREGRRLRKQTYTRVLEFLNMEPV